MFVSFLKAYYEWLETFGTPVWNGKVVGTSVNTVVLTTQAAVDAQKAVAQASAPITETITQAATYLNAYRNMFIVCLNGPAKGHTHKIKSYDPTTWTVTLVDTFDPNNIPPPNTLMEIRDSYSPEKLVEYRDIDYTLDRFIQYFRDEFMYLIPGTILANPREVLKHIKQFYQARGTENSFRFIFRCLFSEEIELYYPKVDLFRASDGIWFVQNVMKTTTTDLTFDYLNRNLVGVYSGATAKVESVTQQLIPQGTITTMTLSSIVGGFQIDPNTGFPEQVKIVYNVPPPPQTDLGSTTDLLEPYNQLRYESAYQLLQHLPILTPGDNYKVGELITIDGGGSLSSAQAIITSIFQTYFTGSCGIPPSVYYLQPFFGPATAPINTDGNPMDDAICIPGMYFFSDVHSSYTDADLLNPNEILLSSNEISTDDFFVGDEITLVGGTGVGQRRTVVSYNGTTKVATVDLPWITIPDSTTQYSITHVRGGIKSIAIIDFGLGFLATPSVTIHTEKGSGGVLPPVLGIVAQTAGRWLQGRDGGVGGFPTTPDSFASSNKIIQDSYYWQDFSYDIRVGETIDKYRDVVKALLHPAGMMMFGSVVLESKPETNFLGIIRENILQIENKLVRFHTLYTAELDQAWRTYVTYTNLPYTYSTLTVGQKAELQAAYALIEAALYEPWEVNDTGRVIYTRQLNTIIPKVIGSKNKDFDWMKFIAFPPNVKWDVLYPYPNQNYWSPTGPGNTQIANLKNRTIGSFVNFPDQRTKISPDANIQIQSALSSTLVGPIGQSRASISQFRFVGFPPFDGFGETYPPPNEDYWSQFGNTQIGNLQNIVLSDLIVSPETKHSNLCVDSDVAIYTPGTIPTIGDVVEYNFLEGMDPQIVYNVSPNSMGEFDGVLGNTILVETIDGTWVVAGVQLDSSHSEIVNATGVPLNLSQCSVLVIALCPDISTNMSIVNCINSSSDNGFSVDVRAGGGVSFRVQYNNTAKSVDFPTGTIKDGNYFMAVLRFDKGKLSGNVSNSRADSVTYSNYPVVPTINTTGWYFGKPSSNYAPTEQPASLYARTTFGTNEYKQASSSGSSSPVGYFNGTLVYAIFYDRAIYDFEIDSAYQALRTMLASERGVILHNTTIKNQFGTTRILRTAEQQTQGGHYWIVKRKFQSGISRIRQTRTYTQSGVSRIYVTTHHNLTGVSALRHSNFQGQTGLSRIQVRHNPASFGVSRIQITTPHVQHGTSKLAIVTNKTHTGVSRIQATTRQMTDLGVSRIQAINTKTRIGATRIQATALQTITGLSEIRLTKTKTQNGISSIRKTTIKVELGVSRIRATTTRTRTGVLRVRVTVPKTHTGVSRITAETDHNITGLSRIKITTTQMQVGISNITP